MNTFRSALCAVALLLYPAAASAQEASAEKTEAGPVDPARLTFARATVDYLFPLGTYARIMDKTMETMMGTIMQGAGEIPVRDIAAMSGMPQEELENLGEGTLNQVMEIVDPAYEERMDRSMRVMMAEMGTLMGKFEPAIREGLAQAYARRFDKQQLQELNAFFSTPTGKAYARDSMVIFMDPAVMDKMQAFMPEFMKEMPNFTARMAEATADLPAPKRPSDLSDEDRRKLAELLGTTPEKLGRTGS